MSQKQADVERQVSEIEKLNLSIDFLENEMKNLRKQ